MKKYRLFIYVFLVTLLLMLPFTVQNFKIESNKVLAADEIENYKAHSIESITIEGYEENLDPAFSPGKYNYNLTIPSSVIDLNIEATPMTQGDKITITGNRYMKNNSGTITIRVEKTETSTPSDDSETETSSTYTINYTKSFNSKSWTFEQLDQAQTFTPIEDGVYQIELWGAQGNGDNYEFFGGKGAYTKGKIELNTETTLYLYIGRSRTDKYPSFNAGSTGGEINDGGNITVGYGGGGATDVRLVNGNWNDEVSLRSRIMVAAGGGGATNYDEIDGGAGGKLIGLPGNTSNTSLEHTVPTGGTQTSGGTTSLFTENGKLGTAGTFGIGGNGNATYGSGGGGGYYGGGGAGYSGDTVDTGAGGSSYISGYTGSIAVAAETATVARDNLAGERCVDGTTDIVCSYHYSGKRFINPIMIAGNEEMPSKDGNGTTIGNEEDGFAKITLMDPLSDDYYLTSLIPSEGAFIETFDPLNQRYTLKLSSYTSKVSFTGTTSHADALVAGFDEEFKLNLGETRRINIIVTSPSGKTQTYTVVATRSLDDLQTNSTKLSSISIENGKYTIDFDPFEYEYTIDITEDALELNMTAIPFDEEATYKVKDFEHLLANTGTAKIVVSKEGLEDTTYLIHYNKTLKNFDLALSTQVFTYTGNYQTYTVPYTTYYKIQLWGGAGSGIGYGAYTEGIIFLEKGVNLYFYVGNNATSGNNKTTFNNGTGNQGGYNGGGSTDVRLTPGTWYDFSSIKSRIMVAGAGGCADNGNQAGAAGGLVGYSGRGTAGGTQTSPGAVQHSSHTVSRLGVANGGCTGGNGYYPGGGATCASGAGGGSSYISGHEGCNSIAEESTENNVIHTGRANHYSGYVFEDTIMIDGKGYEWTTEIGEYVGMPTFDGSSKMTGNSSAGRAQISLMSLSNDDYLSYVTSDIGNWDKEFDPTVYEYNITIDKYKTFINFNGEVSDPNALVSGFKEYKINPGQTRKIVITVTAPSGRTRNYTFYVTRETITEGEHSTKLAYLEIEDFLMNEIFDSLNTIYSVDVSKNVFDLNIIPTPFDPEAEITITGNKYMNEDYDVIKILVTIPNCETCESTEYKIYYTKNDFGDSTETYEYTGEYETFVAPYNGKYKIELWGASGGRSMDQGGYTGSYSHPGGLGGYTSGIISLKKDDELYIYVGGEGEKAVKYGDAKGGWNGGGNATHDHSDDESAGAGGGATDVRLISGEWNNEQSLLSRIMVAGGGGGAAYGAAGGYAGGLSGAKSYYGSAATQTSGYAFGIGQDGIFVNSNVEVAGGGGGWYGGTAPSSGRNDVYNASGGGGSSYISGHTGSVATISGTNEDPRKNSIGSTCANGTTDIVCSYHYSGYIFTDTEMVDGNNLMPNHTGSDRMKGNSGNGYAKISLYDTKSQNAYLDEIKVRNINYEEENLVEFEFDPLVNEYNITIDKYVRAFNVEATLSDENAKITGLGKYIVEPGQTIDITLTVTAVNGNTNTYILHVTREQELEHTNLLKNLTIDKYDLNEDFYSQKFDYTVDIYDVEIDTVINPIPFDNETTFEITGNIYMYTSTGVITVVAHHDGMEDVTYTINYTKVTPSMEPLTFNYTGEYQTFITPFSAKYKIELWGAAGGATAVNHHTTGSSGGMGGYTTGTFKIQKNTPLYIYAGGKGVYGAGSSSYGGPIGGWNGGGNGGNSGSGSGGGATDVRLTPTSSKTIWNETNSLYSRFIVAGGGGGSDDGGSYTGSVGGSNDGAGGSGAGLQGEGAWYDGSYRPGYGGTQTEGNALGQGAHVTTNTDTGGAGGGYWGGLATNYGNGGGGAGSSYIKNYPGADTTYLEYQTGVTYMEGSFTTAANSGNGYAKISMLGIISDNIYIKDLKVTTDLVKTSLINETFDALKANYTATLDKYSELFYVEAELSDDTSTITGLGEYRIEPGESKEINLTVTAESGRTKTYTLTVTREDFEEGEHTTKLKSLKEKTYKFKENFYSSKTDYRMNVYGNEIDTFWEYVTYDPEAIVTIDGDLYLKGHNIIRITVTLPEEYVDENKPDTLPTVYEVVFTKVMTTEPSKNDYLKSLSSSNGTMSPDFDILTHNYTVLLDATETGTRLTGQLDDEKALVTGLDEFYRVEPGTTREVTVIVTSDFGTTRPYKIDITRKPYDETQASTLLKSLVINEYEKDIDFQSEVFEYDIVIPKGEIDLTINAVPYDSTATVTVEDAKYLSGLYGTITITVSKEGLQDSIYHINYTKYDDYTTTFTKGNKTYQTFEAPYTGKYTFELWGASGGRSTCDGSYTNCEARVGGKGGYTKGTITLEKGTLLYIYVGEQGQDGVVRGDTPGAWNGGGAATWDHADDETAGAGGGATDIRLVKGEWDYNKSLASRIMVAGAGGGAAYSQVGGYAGGLAGEKAYYAGAADQVSGYAFGIGQDGIWANTNVEVAGGGGGYWGGYAQTSGSANVYKAAGGGGSSYISGHTGSVAIKSITDTTPRLDDNEEQCLMGTTDIVCSYHYSGYIFTDTKMISGNAVQPTHDGGSDQTGNSGDGFVKISMELSQDDYLTDIQSDYGVFDKTFDPLILDYDLHLNQYEAYFNLTGTLSNPNAKVVGLDRMYELELGESKTIPITVTAPNGDVKTYIITAHRDTYTDEHSTKLKLLSVVNYEEGYLTPKFTPINNDYTITIDSSEAEIHVDYEKFDQDATVKVTGDGRIIAEQGVITITVTYPSVEPTIYTITYKLESIPEGSSFTYDYTGEAQKFVVPTTGHYKLDIWGAQGGGNDSVFNNGNLGAGGRGGYSTGIIKLYKDQILYVYVGGRGHASNDSIALGGFNGGGAAWGTNSSEPAAGGGGATDIRTELNNLYTRFIVAGGGGGGGEDSETGGVGGGTNGGNGGSDCYGTQTTGRCGAVFGSGASTPYDGGGGGGGWYGGGTAGGSQTLPTGNNGTDTNGGSGGSGFVLTSSTATNVPTGYKLDSEWYLTEARTVSGGSVMPTTDLSTIEYGRYGDGFARITLIDKVSRNNYLVDLQTDYGTLTPNFNTDIQSYDLTLDAYTPRFTLTGRASDSEATIQGLGSYNIEPGESKVIDVIVTASAGDTRTYKVNVSRAEFTDEHSSLLSDLRIEGGYDYLPGFNSKVYEYNIDFYYNLTDINLITSTYDQDAEVIIKDNRHISDSGVITIEVKCPQLEKVTYIINYTRNKSLEGYIPTNKDVVTEFNYTGKYQTFTAPDNGDYIIELWGAQGNHPNNGRATGGKGAYTYGILSLKKDEKLYVYVGENRTDRSASFNAGTTGGSSSDTTNGGAANGYGGGGATDVRLTAGTWNDLTSLKSRIMVAGGGGGASNYAYPADGGDAGALVGYSGHNGKYPTVGIPNTPPTGGTQTSGGSPSVLEASGGNGVAGGFGTGGNGHSGWGAAGGGGYWNGGGGGHTSNSVDSGAGGSSYISGYTGSVAIASSSVTTPKTDLSGALCANGTTDITCSYHYSEKIFTNPIMLSGKDLMPSKTGTGYTYGNTGSGYAKITQILKDEDNYLKSLTTNYGLLVQKENPTKVFDPLVTEYTLTLSQNDPTFTLSGTLSHKDATVTGLGYYELALGETKEIMVTVTSESGATKTYTITATRAGFSGEHTSKLSYVKIYNSYDERIYINEDFNSLVTNYTFDLYENYFYVRIEPTPLDPEATYVVYDNEYLKDESATVTLVVSAPGVEDTTYKFTYTKTDYFDYTQISGSSGLSDNGTIEYNYTGREEVFTATKGGYYKLEVWGAQGGGTGGYGAYAMGYTFLKYNESLYLNVGGQGGTSNGGYNGGGGVCARYAGGGATSIAKKSGLLSSLSGNKDSVIIVAGGGGGYGMSYTGGHAGGIRGNNGIGDDVGYGGTQTDGGASGQYGKGAGGFGYGGYGNWSCENQGGGGAGWYGGSSGGGLNNNGSGGGGSSYIGNPQLESLYDNTKHMTCYSCTTSSDINTLTYSVTKASQTATEDYAKLGHGYAKLSYVGRASEDNYLTSLTSSVGKMTQTETGNEEFSPIVYDYTLVIDKYDEWYTLNAVSSDEFAIISGNTEYRIEPGEDQIITIAITAQSGDVRNYTVHVHRNDFTNVHTTKLKDIDINTYEDSIDPRFHSLEYSYDIEVLRGEISLLIDTVAYDELATVEFTTDDPLNQIVDNRINYISTDEGNVYITVSLPDNLVDNTKPETKPTTYVIHWTKADLIASSTDEFKCTKGYQEWTAPYDGVFTFEAWGAQGGTGNFTYEAIERGGLGAYTKGQITLTKDQKIYIYVGCAGASAPNRSNGTVAGGYNGGAQGVSGGSDDKAAGGGGATDFRLYVSEDKAWNNTESLASRIMVAAGGGGGHSYNSVNVDARAQWPGMAGQALSWSGSMGQWQGGTHSASVTQTSGGGFGYSNTYTYLNGIHGAGGGGGGYWGGPTNTNSYGGPGVGGTSFISGYTGAVAVKSQTDISPKQITDANGNVTTCANGTTDRNCSIHYSGLKFWNGVMLTGRQTMPKHNGTLETQVGNTGDGYARISKTNADRDNYLLNLTVQIDKKFKTDTWDNVEGAVYSPVFDKFTDTYYLELPDHVTDITLGARLSSDAATIEGVGNHEVFAGENVYPLVVTSESGEERTYKLIVTRPASRESRATNITVTGFVELLCKPYASEGYCKLGPAEFDSDTTSYAVTVPSGIRELEWTTTQMHAYQTVKGSGVTRLGPWTNYITVEVQAESCKYIEPGETCEDITDYTYIVNRDMTGDNYLDQLIINDPDIDIGFDYLLSEYSFRIPNEYESLDMTVITDDPNATYEVIGNENFEVGTNIVEIIVTAANGEQRSYVLNVYRLENGDKLLKELHVKNGTTEYTLNPPFEDITTSYTLDVPNEISSITITATAHTKTSIAGTGTHQLKTGLNEIHVVTTAQNGDSENYTIVVNRAKSDNAYLSTLSALEGRLNETFVKTNNNYTMTVNPYVKKLSLNANPEESVASVKITGNDNFKIGPNTVKITVTAENGRTNTYTLIVTKEGSRINTLKSLTTNRGEVTPTFDPNTTGYRVNVPNNITDVTVSGEMTDTLSKVTGFGTYRLAVGDNIIAIAVTSETNETKTYNVNVYRDYNSNTDLSYLTVNKGTLTPSFTNEVDRYTVNVNNDVTNITVNAKASVNTTSLTGTGTYNLEIGENIITVTATSEKGTTRDYVITVTRDKSSDTNLAELLIKEARIKPTFSPMTIEYNATVLYDIEDVTVVAVPKDPNSTVTITGNTGLEVGNNEIIVTVTAQDNSAKEYKINVRRLSEEESPDLYLSSLTVSNCEIEFNKKTYSYECTVENEIKQVTIEATPENTSDLVEGTGIFDLNTLDNYKQVVVTDGEYERVYTVDIIRLKNRESRLDNILVTDHEYEPEFTPDTLTYYITTDEYELDFEFIKKHPNQTVEVIGNDNMIVGENEILIKVTSEDGENETTYRFVVTRNIRNNNFLSDLWVEDEEITPEFNKLVSNYKLQVPYETTGVIIGATAEDRNATIEGTGMKPLTVGPNTFTVRVKAENGEYREYRLTVTRAASPNNYLSSLTIEGETYTPVFDKERLNYTLSVPYETEEINIIAETEDQDATVIGDGVVSLKQGVNNVEVYVVAPNGNVRTYTIKVTRKDPITAKLLNIEVENYTLDPLFTPDNQLYQVTVDYETTRLNFIITKMDPYSTYEIVGNRNFKIGINEVVINVTSSNRIDTFQYKVMVNRQAYSNTFLSSLTVNQGTLTPEFKKNTLTYNVEVENGIEDIVIDGSQDNPSSTVEGFGSHQLQVGINTIPITVTSPSGIKRIYTVRVTRKKSSNAAVTSITSNIGVLTKEDDYIYKLVVPKYTTNIGKANFIVKTEDPDATVSMPVTIDLSRTTVYPIKVTSPDGTRTKEYTVNVEFDLSHDATLASLIPSVGELSPKFDPNHNNYRIDLFDDETEEFFDLYLNEVEATLLNRSLTYQLKKLETLAEISIQAEDGQINTYEILIVKSKTKEKLVNNIMVTGVYEIDPTVNIPSFRTRISNYEFEVPYEVEKIGFEVVKRHPAQVIKVYKDDTLLTGDKYSLDVGVNNFRIDIVNSLDEVTSYTYTITRKPSTNANLKTLGLTDPLMNIEAFDKDILDYSLVVPNEYSDVTVNAIPEVDGSRVTINGARNLEEGIERDIIIKVTAPDGKTTKTYTLNVLRKPPVDNLLEVLTISSGRIYEFTPKFRPGTDTYTLKVPSTISSVQVDAYPYDRENVRVSINRGTPNGEGDNNYTTDLNFGDNSIIVTTTTTFEGSDYTRQYKINVFRPSSNDALLENIKVLNAELVEDFTSSNENYTVNAPNDIDHLELQVTPEDRAATYEIIGNEDLGFGKENIVKIKVTSADKTTSKTYNLHVHMKGEANPYLLGIKVDDVYIADFNKYIEEYNISVENAISRIKIEGVPESVNSTVSTSVENMFDLAVGENQIDIIVTAQDGETTKTYSVIVTREENAYLSGIVTDRGNVTYLDEDENVITTFNPLQYEYNLTVENEIEDITIIGFAQDSNSQVFGNGKYELKVGTTPIYISVRNGSTRKVYTLNVTRKGSSNTNLLYLTSTDGDIEPAYTNDNDHYEIHVPNYKTKLSLAYEVENLATVKIIDNELSGTESTVKLLITAEDGTTRTIDIKVYLEEGSYFNSRLSKLEVQEGTIAPKFDPDTYDYTLTVNQAVVTAHITAIPEEESSVVAGAEDFNLELGRNQRTITVTARDGSTTTYTLIVFRKDMDNADLTGLYTDIGELDPAFNPKIYNYTIDVPEETRKVHLTAVAYEEKTIEGDGDVYLGKGITTRNIKVTSESGITNTYVVNINRALSTNHDITNITESTGQMLPIFDPNVLEYNMKLGDVKTDLDKTYVATSHVVFDVTTYSELAEVIYEKEIVTEDEDGNPTVERITLPTNDVSLDYGDNKFIIYAMSEDGNTSSEYVFNIYRIHDLTNITVPGDATGPAMLDGSPNHISVQPGGTFDLFSEITYTPEDADFKELLFTSNNTNLVTIDANGLITAADVLDKSTTITVRSKYYPNIVKTVNVTVEITLISSDV